jgi:hypothetical protein
MLIQVVPLLLDHYDTALSVLSRVASEGRDCVFARKGTAPSRLIKEQLSQQSRANSQQPVLCM